MQIAQSRKLANVAYDIRGPVLEEAKRLEEEGHRVTKLNIGNPAPFGFEAPEEILRDVMLNLPSAQGYSDSKGLCPSPRWRAAAACCSSPPRSTTRSSTTRPRTSARRPWRRTCCA